MIRHLNFLALVLSAFATGCGNSPDSVCKKIGALEAKAGRTENPTECLKKVGEIKEKDPAKFECLAKCADGADMDKVKSCIVGCADTAASAKPAK